MPVEMLGKLKKSKFRSSFKLKESDKGYILKIGDEELRNHVKKFLNERIRIKKANDGKQTPWKGHPCFVAQHALALCCRKCMEKWYKIPQEKELSDIEIDYFTNLIMLWITANSDMNNCVS